MTHHRRTIVPPVSRLQIPNVSKSISLQMQTIMEPYIRAQKQIASMKDIFEPYRKMQESIASITSQVFRPLQAQQEAIERFSKTISSVFESRQLSQQKLAEQVAAIYAPSIRLQEQMASTVSKIILVHNNLLGTSIQRLLDDLNDYRPDVESLDDGFVIDGETYTQSEIEQTLLEGDVLTNPSTWAYLKPAIKYILLGLVMPVIINLLTNYFAYNQVPFAHLIHQQKAEIRQIKSEIKSHPQVERLPFISRDGLPMYASAKRHSRILAYLPFQTEVQVLEYRNKKRWLLIEWEDEGEPCRGWVLGRHIFRPSKYQRGN